MSGLIFGYDPDDEPEDEQRAGNAGDDDEQDALRAAPPSTPPFYKNPEMEAPKKDATVPAPRLHVIQHLRADGTCPRAPVDEYGICSCPDGVIDSRQGIALCACCWGLL